MIDVSKIQSEDIKQIALALIEQEKKLQVLVDKLKELAVKMG